jgi:hypothetical protein
MSKQTQQLFEQVKAGEQSPGLVQTIAPGLSLGKILSDVGTELVEQTKHGAHELSAALFRGSDAFVMYPRTNQSDGPEQGPPDLQQEHARDGREI